LASLFANTSNEASLYYTMETSNTSLIDHARELQSAKGRPRRNTVTFSDDIVTHEFRSDENQCARHTNNDSFNNEDGDIDADVVVFPAIQVWDIDNSETFVQYMNNLQSILS
jgi:hypothetical protein